MTSRRCGAKLGLCLAVLQRGMNMKKLVCLLLVLGPVIASAQADNSTPPTTANAPATVAPKGSANASGKLEISLDQLRDRLVLQPEQQALWGAYADKVNAYADVFYREKPVLASQESTALHQVVRLVDNMQNRLAALEDVESAAKKLFESLSPDQKKTANQLLIATIPTFNSYAPSASDDGARKSAKPDSALRQRRGGAGRMGATGGG